MAKATSLNINGKLYSVDSLNEAAKIQIANIEGADMEITRLQRQLALAQTARNAYVAALSAEINAISDKAPEPETPKKTRKPRAKA